MNEDEKCTPARPQTACGDPWPCACDVCALTEALEHKKADKRCGRSWQCSCANCRRARELIAKYPPEVRKRLLRRHAVLRIIDDLRVEPAAPPSEPTPGREGG